MHYKRTFIGIEAPEELNQTVHYALSESGVGDRTLADLGISVPIGQPLTYTAHQGRARLRTLVAKCYGLDAVDILVTTVAPRRYCGSAAAEHQTDQSHSTPNPTDSMIIEEQLRKVADLARNHSCYLLVDETFAELMSPNRLPCAASLGSHVIWVSSMSKAYGVPSIRVGWISSKNKLLHEAFLVAKEQTSITVGVLDEYVAECILERREELLQPVRLEMKSRRDLVDAWVQEEDMVEWVRPEAMSIALIRMTREPPGGATSFYSRLLKEQATYVGPGHWFELPETCFRLGYGWPAMEDLKKGLAAISRALRG
ncbi:aspartate aminotransferase [Aspergillus affinis]|uniref:aspartate aminotransferase n=1 Tax=Aspergillus affinis TaxID=1070780 RepID=UPI0022FDBC0E|nr:aspartate aminotransferase [Aspergillus affinis]KAI9039953.1 aspartate aminotransferase [Aspergillus affinis]